MDKQKAVKVLNDNMGVQLLKEANFLGTGAFLTGGAVVDILEMRGVKDYDILGHYGHTDVVRLIRSGFEYKYETGYSITLTKQGYLFQLLKTDIKRFDFTISQSEFHFKTGYLRIDEVALTNKLLIPTSFTDKKVILDALYRIPHWKQKGYYMRDETYISLVSSLNSKLNRES